MLKEGSKWKGMILPVVGKDSKYSVRSWKGKYHISIEMTDEDTKISLYSPGGEEIVNAINSFLVSIDMQQGGVFYFTECRHVIKPITNDDKTVDYYYIGTFPNINFHFYHRNRELDSSQIDSFSCGDYYPFPPVGMRYFYHLSPARITGTRIEHSEWSKTETNKNLEHRNTVDYVTKMLYKASKKNSGRFYINEHRVIFTPVQEGKEVRYKYVTQLDFNEYSWFSCDV